MQDFQLLARTVILEYIKTRLDKSDPPFEITLDDVFVVWFSKTLQNWKALISSVLPDQKYYEITYNGDADELYIDEYLKVVNKKIKAFSSLGLVYDAPH